jgi:gamma-glutamylcysteine synthetase
MRENISDICINKEKNISNIYINVNKNMVGFQRIFIYLMGVERI